MGNALLGCRESQPLSNLIQDILVYKSSISVLAKIYNTRLFKKEVCVPTKRNIDDLILQMDAHRLPHFIKKVRLHLNTINEYFDLPLEYEESKQLSWIACKHFNLRPKGDFLDKILGEDVVEIYSLDFKQMYCSPNFWNYVSYSLDEVFTKEFTDLYSRPEGVTNLIIEAIHNAVQNKETCLVNSPEHIMREKLSDVNKSFKMKVKYISPLFCRRTKQVSAFASIISATSLD